MLRVAIGTPWSSPFMYTKYVDSVLDLRHPKDCELRYFRGRGWCPARRHADLCERAIEWGADIIIIIGADQVYEPDMLERLVGRYLEGYSLVGLMVPCREHINKDARPFQPLAWKMEDGKFCLIEKDGTMKRADVIGTGVTMFSASLLLKLERPWFRETIDPVTFERTGNQDSTFIHRLGQIEPLWIDTSINVEHLHIMNIDDTFQYRFEDWGRSGGNKT